MYDDGGILIMLLCRKHITESHTQHRRLHSMAWHGHIPSMCVRSSTLCTVKACGVGHAHAGHHIFLPGYRTRMIARGCTGTHVMGGMWRPTTTSCAQQHVHMLHKEEGAFPCNSGGGMTRNTPMHNTSSTPPHGPSFVRYVETTSMGMPPLRSSACCTQPKGQTKLHIIHHHTVHRCISSCCTLLENVLRDTQDCL